MGTCQQQWCDPDDFENRTCGAETDRQEGDRFVCNVCAGRIIELHQKMAAKMQCPLCWKPLSLVPAREMHPAHAEHDLARKCTPGWRSDGQGGCANRAAPAAAEDGEAPFHGGCSAPWR